MNQKEVIDHIRNLDVPSKAKAELLMLWHKARHMVEKLLKFIKRHREIAETVLVGALIAYLLAHIPWIGTFLALCTLVTAAGLGVLKQLRADIARMFEEVPA